MVLAVVLDGEGRPVCTEMLEDNTADMTVLLPVADRLRKRFGIGRVCVVAIRGHVFCSFLALVLQKELADLCRSHEITVEWDDLIRDLDRLQEATIEKDGKRVTTRTPVSGQVFQAAGIALPPNWREHPG